MEKVKVLIVEDEVFIARDLEMNLVQMGYTVLSLVPTGELAIQKIEEERPDIVLIDIVLQGDMDGIETAEIIQTKFDIPVIYLTAHREKKLFERAKKTEPFGYINKPFRNEELHNIIELSLHKFRAEGERKKLLRKLEDEIAGRKSVERALRDSEKNYYNLIDTAQDAIISFNEGGIINIWNHSAERIFGYSRSEIIGKPVINIISEKHREEFQEELKRFSDSDETRVIGKMVEVTGTTKDGNEIFTEISLAARMIEKGQIYFTAIVRDITRRKKMELELLKFQKLESLGILAGGIAHDFNNYLTSVFGNIALAKIAHNKGADVYDKLMELEKVSLLMRNLTLQLLTFSKGGAPLLELTPIKDVICETVSFSLRGTKTAAEINIEDNLRPVKIDTGQISQVINNMVINGDQAMPEGGVISVKAENITIENDEIPKLSVGEYVRISIKDQGPGIDNEHMQKIFDPFFTTKQMGSGLGLATCYSIVEKHGGHIGVESYPGRGSTFHIYIPVYQEKTRLKNVVKESGSGGEKEDLGRRKNGVMIMDDDESIRDTTGALLGKMGYDVRVAKDGSEAIKLYLEAKESGMPFDAVILDLTVTGGMGGKDTVRKLLEIDPNVKAIVSSGYSHNPIISQYREYGFVGVMPKPYDFQKLKDVLHNVILGID
ncbi:MAG: response regulator [Planctomycetes bacterium]|nr:response regulator [Planctomycetota bacterium]